MTETRQQAQSFAAEQLPYSAEPELVFGLVGPVGVDLDFVKHVLEEFLSEVSYTVSYLRITALMREVNVGLPLEASTYIDIIRERIAYANRVCEKIGRKDALAILAISAIRQTRKSEGGNAEEPIKRRAYIIHQFKRPDEVQLLRAVYGRQFIQVSVYAPQAFRIETITQKELETKRQGNALTPRVEAVNAANDLVRQDEAEQELSFGQNVRDAFPLGDVFITSHDSESCRKTLGRFIRALFGDNRVTPERDEYGMYIAKSASLRSSSDSRQVGSAIFTQAGELISMGSNEVPKAGGGTYWTGDKNDSRDFVVGRDSSHANRIALLTDIIRRLLKHRHLSSPLCELNNPDKIVEMLRSDDSPDGVEQSRVMDVLEFGRDIHAEMSAISDAARNGLSTKNAVLYCTTFPCHICAKHIIASGIKRVVYIEPYPKSYAQDLHPDSIEIDGDGRSERVGFQRFIGISPFRYRDLFEKGSRKYLTGIAKQGSLQARPVLEVLYPSYFTAETYVVRLLENRLSQMSETE